MLVLWHFMSRLWARIRRSRLVLTYERSIPSLLRSGLPSKYLGIFCIVPSHLAHFRYWCRASVAGEGPDAVTLLRCSIDKFEITQLRQLLYTDEELHAQIFRALAPSRVFKPRGRNMAKAFRFTSPCFVSFVRHQKTWLASLFRLIFPSSHYPPAQTTTHLKDSLYSVIDRSILLT